MEAIRAQQQPVAEIEIEVQRVDQHGLEDAQRAGDDVLEVRLAGLLRRQRALLDPLLHEAVVLGELVHLGAPLQVDPAIPDMGDEGRGADDQQGVEGGAHLPALPGDGVGGLVHLPARLLQRLLEEVLVRPRPSSEGASR